MLVGVVGFLGSEVVLSLVVSGCLPSCGRWVLVGVAAFLGSEVVLSPVVSGCLPSCGGWVLAGVAASRTKTFRNQNHRFQSKFAYWKVFGVYAGVILWLGSGDLKSNRIRRLVDVHSPGMLAHMLVVNTTKGLYEHSCTIWKEICYETSFATSILAQGCIYRLV